MGTQEGQYCSLFLCPVLTLQQSGKNFMDITATGHTYPYIELSEQSEVKYPSKPAYNTTVKKLAKELSKKQIFLWRRVCQLAV